MSNVEFQVVWEMGRHGWACGLFPLPNLALGLGLLTWPLSKLSAGRAEGGMETELGAADLAVLPVRMW